jgi:glutathione synthase/RimK-type ligase-like ATP-grasp enzyme
MILLLGPAGDELIAFVSLRLLALEEPFVLIDPGQIANGQVSFRWDPARPDAGFLRHGSRQIGLADVESIYLREVGSIDAPSDLTPALLAFTEETDALVLNRASASATNSSKPFQARRIVENGFRTPPTLITTDPSAARTFYKEHDGRTIHKSVSAVRSIVVLTTPDDLERLELVRNCPTQFQALVQGTDVRVHVVGERVFATEVTTRAVDYRYAALEGVDRVMRDYVLPDDVAERCVQLSRDLGMGISGVDLRRGSDGEWWCFEVNPSPGFTFYQAHTGQPIGHAVVDLLRTAHF